MNRPARPRARTRARGWTWRSILTVSESRLAGYCAMALAATLVLTVVAYVLLPGRPTDANGILNLAGTSPGWFRFLYGVLALGGFFGLAVVGPITAMAGEAAPQWVAWSRRLAYVAFAVTVLQGARMAALLPQVGALYHGCFKCNVSLAVQQDVARGIYLSLPLDPIYVVIFGGVGLWTLAVSGASLLSGSVPRALSFVGVALSVGYLVLIITLASGHVTLFALASVVTGVLLGPAWYIWLGVLLTVRSR